MSTAPATGVDWDAPPPPREPWPGALILIVVAGTLLAAWATLALFRWRIGETDIPEFIKSNEFALWLLLMTAQVASWVFFFTILMRRLGLLSKAICMRVQSDRKRRLLWSRAVVFCGVVMLVLLVPLQAGRELGLESEAPLWAHTAKSMAVTLIGLAAALPAMLAASLARDFAELEAGWPATSCSVDLNWVAFLRQQFKTVVGILSIEVAMVVLVTGALSKALAVVESGDLSNNLVLAYGALFTLIVMAAYTYGRTAIDRRASKVLDQWTPLPKRPENADEASAMKTQMDQRSALRSQLGLDVSLREGLGTTVLVGLPFLSAFMSEVVGTKVI